MSRKRASSSGLAIAILMVMTFVSSVASAGLSDWQKERWAVGKTTATKERVAVEPIPAAVEAKHALDEAYPRPWGIKWDRATGLPRSLWAPVKKRSSGTPEEVAEEFIAEHRPLFTGIPPDLDRGRVTFKWGGTSAYTAATSSVVFHQYVDDVPVFMATVFVHVDDGGQVSTAGGNPYYLGSAETTPALTAENAIAVFRTLALPDSVHIVGIPELVIWPFTSPARPAYVFGGYIAGLPFEVILDAVDGMPFHLNPMFAYDPSISSNGDSLKEAPDTVQSIPGPFYRNLPTRSEPDPTPARPPKNDSGNSLRAEYSRQRTEALATRRGASAGDRWTDRVIVHDGPTSSSTATASASVWFKSGFYDQSPEDRDSDGYARRGYVVVDIDTDVPDMTVVITLYARDALDQEQLVETVYWPISGVEFDEAYLAFDAPYRSTWDFRIVVSNTQGAPLLTWEYGQIGPGMEFPEDNPMEYVGEDALFVYLGEGDFDAPVVEGYVDTDGNGYYDTCELIYKVHCIYPRDTTYLVYAYYYARDNSGLEMLLGISVPYEVHSSTTASVVRRTMIPYFPGSKEEWDFGVELYTFECFNTCLLSSVPYEAAPQNADPTLHSWTDFKAERWNEDRDLTTVFQPNPIYSLDDPSLWDQDDWLGATPWMPGSGAYYPVTLSHLQAGLGTLIGDYVWLGEVPSNFFGDGEDYGDPVYPPVMAEDGAFPFLRDQPGFEAVMAYHYIDINQTYIQAIGFDSAFNKQIFVDAHAMNGGDDATYKIRPNDFGNGLIMLGDGGTDAGEDGELILHEYAHAVVDDLTGNGLFLRQNPIDPFNESLSMMEGIADYWACSWTDSFYASGSPSGNYAAWEARSSDEAVSYLRQTTTDKHYDFDMGAEYHLNGEIWSACLWEMMLSMGKRVTDSTVLRSAELLRDDSIVYPWYEVGAEYILKADTASYGASHAVTIGQIFVDRGILQCDCPHQGDVSADGFIDSIDLSLLIDLIWFGGDLAHDALCSTPRGDWTNDGYVDSIDLAFMIDYVFFGGSPPVGPCMP